MAGRVRRAVYDVPLPNGQRLRLGERTLVMAIVNVTPDSFSDGGQRESADVAIADALQMVADGADVLDIGGESTRPGADPLGVDQEWQRIGPVIEGLVGRVTVPISVDTYKAEIARRALAAGATIVNDISALAYDPALGPVVADAGAALILMHNRGRSADMYAHAHYEDVVAETRAELQARIDEAVQAGVEPTRLLIDPGFGFAKRPEHTAALLAGLEEIAALGFPVVSGPSRKSFLQAALGARPPADRVWGTAAAVALSVWLGAHLVRVHDVAAMRDVVQVTDLLSHAGGGGV